MTLSGVLKDILLVISSLVIFGDPVTGQQYLGYSIALGGLVYYKLGAEKLQSVAADARLYLTQGRGNLPSKLVQGVIYVGLALVVLAILGYWRGANVASLTTPGV